MYENWRLESEVNTMFFKERKHHVIYSFSKDMSKVARVKIIPSSKTGQYLTNLLEDLSNYLTSRLSRCQNMESCLQEMWDESPRDYGNKPATIMGFIIKDLLRRKLWKI
jgi:hypothetical protein